MLLLLKCFRVYKSAPASERTRGWSNIFLQNFVSASLVRALIKAKRARGKPENYVFLKPYNHVHHGYTFIPR